MTTFTYTPIYDENEQLIGYSVSNATETGHPTTATIPSEYNGYPVIECGSVFVSSTWRSLQSVTIPASIVKMSSKFHNSNYALNVYYQGTMAQWCNITFSGANTNPLWKNGLGSGGVLYINNQPQYNIVIPNTVTTIKDYAFQDAAISSISIPEGVTSIGQEAFDWYGYNDYDTSLVVSNITLPSTLVSIGNRAFDGRRMKDIRFADNSQITSIEFYGCGAENIYFPEGATSIRTTNCWRLKTITLPSTATTVYVYFANKVPSTFNKVYYNGTLAQWCGITFSYNPLQYAHYLYIDNVRLSGNIEIPSSVTEIKKGAFYGCYAIEKIIINNTVTRIGDFAFYDCADLQSIQIKSTTPPTLEGTRHLGTPSYYTYDNFNGTCSCVIYVPEAAFNTYKTATGWSTYFDAGRLDYYTVVPTYTYTAISEDNIIIGYSVVCSNINEYPTSAEIPATYNDLPVLALGQNAFKNCTSISTVVIPSTIINFDEDAFSGCTGLKRVYFNGGIDLWREITFANAAANPVSLAHSLYLDGVRPTVITFKENVTAIKNYTFCGCTSITEITFQTTITDIGDKAFYGCSNLAKITLPCDTPTLGTDALTGISNTASIYITSFAYTAYQNAADWSDYLSLLVVDDLRISFILNANSAKKYFATQAQVEEILEALQNIELEFRDYVPKTTNTNKIYGTDANGHQTTYDKDSFGSNLNLENYGSNSLYALVQKTNTGRENTASGYGVSFGRDNKGQHGYYGILAGYNNLGIGQGADALGGENKVGVRYVKNEGAGTYYFPETNPTYSVYYTSTYTIGINRFGITAQGQVQYIGSDEAVYAATVQDNSYFVMDGVTYTFVRNDTVAGSNDEVISGLRYNVSGDNEANIWSVGIGEGNVIAARDGFASGYKSIVTHRAASAFGERLITGHDGQLVAGINNIGKNDTMFEVGGGQTSDARANLFEVTTDGIARAYGTPVGDNDLMRKQDVDTAFGSLNIKNGLLNGSLTQTNLSYAQMITDFEPNMAAWVYVKAGNQIPADATAYLAALQSSISPTSIQLIDALTNQMASLQVIITNYKDFTGTPYEAYNAYSLDGLIKAQLDDRWGVSSSDNLENTFGRASDGAFGIGFKNKLWSPASITFGFDNEAGDEGYPSESIAAFAGGFFTRTYGNQGFTYGQGDKENNKPLVNNGSASVVFGKVLAQSTNTTSDAGDKANFNAFKAYLADAGVITPSQATDDSYEWYWDGNHSGAYGNASLGGYIGEDVGEGNFAFTKSAVVDSSTDDKKTGNNVVLGWWSVVDGRDNFSGPGVVNQIHNSAGNFIGGSFSKISAEQGYADYSQGNAIFNSRNTIRNSARSTSIGSEGLINKQIAGFVAGRGLKLESSTLDWSNAGRIRFGRYNADGASNIFEIGNGTADNARSNAFAVTDEGYIILPNFTSSDAATPSGYKTFKCVNGTLTAID